MSILTGKPYFYALFARLILLLAEVTLLLTIVTINACLRDYGGKTFQSIERIWAWLSILKVFT